MSKPDLSSNRKVRFQHLHNARYTKLGWQVWKVQFNVLEVWDRLRQSGDTDEIGKSQNLPLSITGMKEVDEVFNTYPRFIKGCAKLPLRTKILFISRIARNIGDLSQSPANGHNNVTPFCYRTRERTGFAFRHELCNIVCHAESGKICAVNYWETCWGETFYLQVRPKRTGGNVSDKVTNSMLC